MPEEKPDTPQQGGLEGLVDQMSKLPALLEELGGRITNLEQRDSERESSRSSSASTNNAFSLEPLGKAIESMTREFTATIRELASGGRTTAAAATDAKPEEKPAPRAEDKPPPPPSPAPPPAQGSRVRELLGTPTLHSSSS